MVYNISWTSESGAHTIVYNDSNNAIIIDGTTLGSGYNITSTTNLIIGRRNTSYNDYPLKGKIYYFKVTDKSTGKLERNMIPCYRKSDNVIGLYDTVNGEFYTNKGTGMFDKGSNEDIEYISSTTQVITNEDHTLYAIWKEDE